MRQVPDRLAENQFLLRTDVRSFYASIDHVLLMDLAGADIERPGGCQSAA